MQCKQEASATAVFLAFLISPTLEEQEETFTYAGGCKSKLCTDGLSKGFLDLGELEDVPGKADSVPALLLTLCLLTERTLG